MPTFGSRVRVTGSCALAVLTVGMLVPMADARLPQQDGSVALPGQANTTIIGASGATVGDPLADRAGEAVAAAGDVNSDGFADVIVGAKGFNGSTFNFGAAYVVFGSPNQLSINLSGLGSNGFRIEGESDADFAGGSVAGGGDVNGDGISDVVVGAGNAGNNPGPGSAYVVFGKASSAPVNLATLAATGQGFEIEGAAVDDKAGFSTAITGDMNSDGRSEVVVGAPAVGADDGVAYVVFGKASATQVSLAALGAAGFQMTGPLGSVAGRSVAGSGDVNSDGRADVVVGAPGANASNGAAYVVFGRSTTTPLTLGSLSDAEGYTIGTPPLGGEEVGDDVASVGDLNGDGRPDFAVGGSGAADLPGRTNAGAAYSVFSPFPPADVDLANLDPGGFRVIGAAADDFAGRRVGGAGDFNGNGFRDVMVSAPCAEVPGLADAGKAYIVDASPVAQADAAALGSRGVTINGGFAEPGACPDNGDPEVAVAGAGDFNGDGRPDAIVGMPRNDNNADNAGAAYILYGYGAAQVTYPGGVDALTGQNVSIGPPSIKRTGAFSFSISPALPAGLGINPSTGAITGSAPRSSTRTSYTVTMTDLSGSATASVPIGIFSPDRDGDGVTLEENDCEDDPARNGAKRAPGNKEIPNNRIDENCNNVLGVDRDRDRAMAKPEGRDCKDRDKRVRPGKRDIPGNNLNEDCKDGKKRGEIRSTLIDLWAVNPRKRVTLPRTLSLQGVPARTTVRVLCQARGCPHRARRVKQRHRAAKFDVLGRFPGFLQRSGVGAGGRLTITLSKPNNASKEFRIEFRVSAQPNCTVTRPRKGGDCTRHPQRRRSR